MNALSAPADSAGADIVSAAASQEPDEAGSSAVAPAKRAHNKKKWGRGIAAALRKKRQRMHLEKPMLVHHTAPRDRKMQLLGCIQRSRLSQEQTAALSTAAKEAWGKRAITSSFGKVVLLLSSSPAAEKFMDLLFQSTLKLHVDECDVEGYGRQTDGTPWLMENHKTSLMHNDVYGQGVRTNRTIPGRHVHMWTLLYIVTATRQCQFCIYSITGERSLPAPEDVLLKVDIEEGGHWVLFPSKLLHQMVVLERGHKRMIASVQFAHTFRGNQ